MLMLVNLYSDQQNHGFEVLTGMHVLGPQGVQRNIYIDSIVIGEHTQWVDMKMIHYGIVSFEDIFTGRCSLGIAAPRKI